MSILTRASVISIPLVGVGVGVGVGGVGGGWLVWGGGGVWGVWGGNSSIRMGTKSIMLYYKSK